jgi:hypothetical protein
VGRLYLLLSAMISSGYESVQIIRWLVRPGNSVEIKPTVLLRYRGSYILSTKDKDLLISNDCVVLSVMNDEE